MSWSIIKRAGEAFVCVFFFPLCHTLLLSGGHRPVSRSLDLLLRTNPMLAMDCGNRIQLYAYVRVCVCTVFFFRFVLHYYYFYFIFILLLSPITLSKSIGTAALEMGAKKHKTGQTAWGTHTHAHVPIYMYNIQTLRRRPWRCIAFVSHHLFRDDKRVYIICITLSEGLEWIIKQTDERNRKDFPAASTRVFRMYLYVGHRGKAVVVHFCKLFRRRKTSSLCGTHLIILQKRRFTKLLLFEKLFK